MSRFTDELHSSDNDSRNFNLGWYRLICSIRDLRLFTKNIIPHRGWRLKDVKEYFDITGNKHAILNKLLVFKADLNKGENTIG